MVLKSRFPSSRIAYLNLLTLNLSGDKEIYLFNKLPKWFLCTNIVWGLLLQDIVTLCIFDFSSEFRVVTEIFSMVFILVSPYLHCSLGYSWNEGKAGEKWEESPVLMFSCGIQFAEVSEKKWVCRGWGEEMILDLLFLWKRTERPWKLWVCHRILHKAISIFRFFYIKTKPFIRVFLIYMKAKQYLNSHMPITLSPIIFIHGWFCPIHTFCIPPFCIILKQVIDNIL